MGNPTMRNFQVCFLILAQIKRLSNNQIPLAFLGSISRDLLVKGGKLLVSWDYDSQDMEK
jgi:hypothetical protein